MKCGICGKDMFWRENDDGWFGHYECPTHGKR